MKLKIAQVVGLNTDQKAAQAISSSRNGEIYFLAVLILSCDDAFTKGRQLLGELSDFYFDFEGSPSEKINATFDETQKKLDNEDFSLLIASIVGKVLYLIGKGEVEVILQRLGKLSPLLSVGAPNQLISGFLKEGDRLLFSTSSLTAFLGDDLAKSLSLPIETFEEEVADRIGASDLENQGLAALAIQIEEEEESIPNLRDEPSLTDQSNESSDYQDSQQSLGSKTNLLSAVQIALAGLLRFLWKLKNHFPKSGRGRLLIAAILILVIAFGVGFKIKSSKDAQKQVSFNLALQQAREDFNGAKGLATLNPADAKTKLDSAKNKANQALSLNPKNLEAQDLKKQIDEESSAILQQSTVADFPTFLDMDLVKKNFRATQMSLSNGKLLLLDSAVKTLILIDLSKKSHQILAGVEQLGEATAASLNGNLAFVFSKGKGVLRVDTTNSKLTIVSKQDSDFGEMKDIYGFAGNVYLLDLGKKDATSSGQIWKYLPTKDGYSDKREYLTKNTKADFATALRMQIESSIYVLKSGGEMLRFTRGDKDNFSYGGLDKGVKDPKSFFVSSDTDNLYLLDSGNSRLLILTKTGSYKGTIAGDKFAQVTDLVVDEKGKKVYLLEGSKIYQVDLK